MLGLLGLVGAMVAGLLGDSVVATRSDSEEGVDRLPETDESAEDVGDGDFLDELEDDGEDPDPDDETAEVDPPEELPGEGPEEVPDPDAQMLIGTNDAELLVGGAGNDGLLGSAGADTMMGAAGNDALVGADDEDADLLMGEDGDDSLTLGAGDTAMGGAGEDAFTLADFGPNTPPSIIADYSADDDHIVLMYDPEIHPDPVVETTAIEGTDDMSVMLDGVQIAIVQGAPGLTQANIQLLST